jgi:hypothetical protein
MLHLHHQHQYGQQQQQQQQQQPIQSANPLYMTSFMSPMQPSMGQSQQPVGHQAGHQATQPRRLILESQKLINIIIKEANELTDFLVEISSLKSAVLEHYGMEPEGIQCQIVNNHLKGQIRATRDKIF